MYHDCKIRLVTTEMTKKISKKDKKKFMYEIIINVCEFNEGCILYVIKRYTY